MELGKKIAYYRKNKNITQDALAKQLGISNQAVSKWETEQSCPDVELLPRIADIFEISLDELFEREYKAAEEATTQSANILPLPWEDDDTLRAVVFQGHRLIQKNEILNSKWRACREITLKCDEIVQNLESYFNVSCGDVGQNVTAGGSVECGDVGKDVVAGAHVECGDVGNNVVADGHIDCGDVGQNVSAQGPVDCGDVEGSVSAAGCITCGDVGGNVQAGGPVQCGDVGGRLC